VPDAMTVKGINEAVAALEELDRNVQKNILRHATRAGAKVVLVAAKSDAPVQGGATRANVKIRAGGTRYGSYRLQVGVGAQDFQGPQFYAAFVLFGHKVGSRRLGDARQQVPANNWLEKSLDESGSGAVDAIEADLVAGVEAAADKA
jgi:HK97 gp10 family phage protein